MPAMRQGILPGLFAAPLSEVRESIEDAIVCAMVIQTR